MAVTIGDSLFVRYKISVCRPWVGMRGRAMKKIEILAPAGSYEALKGAVNAGCDAVYIGGTFFGARAYAKNLSQEELLRAIDEVHIHGKKLYLTANTLVKEREMESLLEYIRPYYCQGLDGVIVQDLGVLSCLHESFPKLPLHASTQMTLTDTEGLAALKDLGVVRAVLSRELSLEEISRIAGETDLELEAFVHGALCVCYSGQCLMSSMIGGRSGNRGRCAQPCRQPYSLKKDHAVCSKAQAPYLLSPKDIYTLDLIPSLVEAGITSFKIEGRMKRPEYAAYTSFLYRKYTDLYLELGSKGYEAYVIKNNALFEADKLALMDLYNRGSFTNGYYKRYHGPDMMSMELPSHNGVLVGKVTGTNEITLSRDVNPQDVLEIRNTQRQSNGDKLLHYTLGTGAKAGQRYRLTMGMGKKASVIKQGDLVYRTKNQMLLSYIEKEFFIKEKKEKIAGRFIGRKGEKIQLSLFFMGLEAVAAGEPADEARNAPVTEEKIREQLIKMGNTPFIMEEMIVELDQDVFFPIGRLNELRRRAVALLLEKITKKYRRTGSLVLPAVKKPVDSTCSHMEGKAGHRKIPLSVSVVTEDQLKAALSFEEVKRIFVSMASFSPGKQEEAIERIQKSGKEACLAFPSVFRRKDQIKAEQELLTEQKRWRLNPNGFLIHNLEELSWIRRHLKEDGGKKHLILNYTLYSYNQKAAETLRKLGGSILTAPVELNFSELSELCLKKAEFIVYGYQPLMTTAQCLVQNTTGCRNGFYEPPMNYQLTDGKKHSFFVVPYCRFCYNTIYNGLPFSALDLKKEIDQLYPESLRLDFSLESGDEAFGVLKEFASVFCHNKERTAGNSPATKGHLRRGVL